MVQEHVDAAADQVLLAAATNDPARVRSTLVYWFGLIFDEAARAAAAEHDAPPPVEGASTERLKRITAELKRMSDRLEQDDEGGDR